MPKKVNLDQVSAEISKIVIAHTKDIPKDIQKINKEYAEIFKNELAATANVGKSRRKKYNKGFAVKQDGTKFIVYNKNKPGLTHLLEFGTYRAKGYYTFTKSWNKISPRLKKKLTVKK